MNNIRVNSSEKNEYFSCIEGMKGKEEIKVLFKVYFILILIDELIIDNLSICFSKII